MKSDSVGKAYNFTHPEVISWTTLIECCSEAMGIPAQVKPIHHESMNGEVRSFFPFRDVDLELDITNLVKDGLSVPSISLRDGLQRTYPWYLKHSPRLTDSRMTRVDEV